MQTQEHIPVGTMIDLMPRAEYRCPICTRTFADYENLKQHYKAAPNKDSPGDSQAESQRAVPVLVEPMDTDVRCNSASG